MSTNIEILTPKKFHEILHKDIDKPVQDFRRKWVPAQKRHVNVHTDAHKASWAEAMIFLKQKIINIQVYLNFKKNNLTDSDYNKLKLLVRVGIMKYWTRHIEISGKIFIVRVQVYHRHENAIPVDLYVETDKDNYARSMNPATLGIDASFIYNKGFYPNENMADDNFQLVSAHEFGHSVLMYAGSFALSWGHKGSTNLITQSVKSSTPGYPKSGPVDLMKYYDWNKSKIQFQRRISDTRAMDVDIKRLIWGAKIKWIN